MGQEHYFPTVKWWLLAYATMDGEITDQGGGEAVIMQVELPTDKSQFICIWSKSKKTYDQSNSFWWC